MHIKFIGRGEGKGSQATDYIMSTHDHTGKKRLIEPEVLRGNPEQTGKLADSLDFKHKYRSAVIDGILMITRLMKIYRKL